jgi:hypothetical protein
MTGKAFQPTSNLRCDTMMREANDFAAHLRRCEASLAGVKAASEDLLSTARNVMTAPLPTVWEETAQGAGGEVRPVVTIGGAGFSPDAIARLSQTASAAMEGQVLVPVKRWLDVHAALSARLKVLEALRLEVDSRRHTVIDLAATVDKLRAKLSRAPGADGRLENQLDDAIKRLQHKEGKLALVAHEFKEKEGALADDLSTLIRDAEWLRHYMATALKLQGDALLGAAAALGPAEGGAAAGGSAADPMLSISMSGLSLGAAGGGRARAGAAGGAAGASADAGAGAAGGSPREAAAPAGAADSHDNPFISSGVMS